jgi:hypothetical protein
VVAGALVALVALLVALTGRLGHADPAPTAATSAATPVPEHPGQTATQTPAPSTSTTPPEPTTTAAAEPTGKPAACDGKGLGVQVSTDARSYAGGAAARFRLTITNTGKTACRLDVGSTAAVELLVTSGKDRVWSSDDCQPEAKPKTVTLQPGDAEEQSATWKLERSAPGCAKGLAEPRKGTYSVVARVGDVRSKPVTFELG